MISSIDNWEEKAGLPLELGVELAELLRAKIPLAMQKWQWISRPSNTKKDDDGWSLYPQLTQQKQERWYLRDPIGWTTVDTLSVEKLLTIRSLLSLMRVWHSSHVTRSREVHSLHLKFGLRQLICNSSLIISNYDGPRILVELPMLIWVINYWAALSKYFHSGWESDLLLLIRARYLAGNSQIDSQDEIFSSYTFCARLCSGTSYLQNSWLAS